MSGIHSVLCGLKSRVNPLSNASVTLTSGSANSPGTNPFPYDMRYYGLSASPAIGSVSGTLAGYTVSTASEEISFNSFSGAYTSPITGRVVRFALTGGARLYQTDFTTLGCPGGNLLTASANSFASGADGGTWTWIVTNGTDDGTADYMSSGTLSITV